MFGRERRRIRRTRNFAGGRKRSHRATAIVLGQTGLSEGTARLRIPLADGFGTVYACAYGDACRN
jgi:hypothetical protein